MLKKLPIVGAQYCRVYSEEDRALAGLVREIRLLGNLIDGFSMAELDSIVYFVSTA